MEFYNEFIQREVRINLVVAERNRAYSEARSLGGAPEYKGDENSSERLAYKRRYDDIYKRLVRNQRDLNRYEYLEKSLKGLVAYMKKNRMIKPGQTPQFPVDRFS